MESIQQFIRVMETLRRKSSEVPLTELMRLVIEETGYELALREDKGLQARTRLENVQELLSATKEFEEVEGEPPLQTFLEQVALSTDIDSKDDTVDAVSLMTLHAAKGLEFPVVFMVGIEENLFPLGRAVASDNRLELEEERRLCYVGITRAQQYLFFTFTEMRTLYGNTSRNLVSRFLSEVPDELMQVTEGGLRSRAVTWREAADVNQAAAQIIGQLTREIHPYQPGDKVRHEKFGDGMVLSAKGEGAEAQVVVFFQGLKQKKTLALAYAPLEIIKNATEETPAEE
jgi:DNA helicase-2/ATP-dependent DNA helicase PcrA